MATYQAVADAIQNVRNGPIREDARGVRGTVVFDYLGTEVVIGEPRDVLLSDDPLSRRWIADRYGWLLTIGAGSPKGVDDGDALQG